MFKKKFEIDISKYSIFWNIELISRGHMPGMKLAIN